MSGPLARPEPAPGSIPGLTIFSTMKPFLVITNVHGVAIGRFARDFGDLARVDPAMTRAQPLVLASFEKYRGHHPRR